MSDELRQNLEKSGEQKDKSNNQTSQPENEGTPSQRHPPNWVEKWTFVLEICGVLGLAVYCALNYMEWSTFDSERMTMESEFRSSQTNFQMQLAEMQRSREDDERAWVGWSGVIFTRPYRTNFVDVVAQNVNTGKTPARIESIIKEIEMTDYITTNIVCLYTNTDELVIAPGGDKIDSELIDSTIGEKDFELLIEKKEELHFMWKITYLDAFNNVRHTDYGFVVKGPESDMATGKICLPYGKPRMD